MLSGELVCDLSAELSGVIGVISNTDKICDEDGICFQNEQVNRNCATQGHNCKSGSFCEDDPGSEKGYKCSCLHGPPICNLIKDLCQGRLKI